MTDAVIVAIIGCVQAVIVAGLGAIATVIVRSNRRTRGEIGRQIGALKYEVTNDHDKPLREDMDDKHNAIVTMLRRDVGGIREDIRLLRRDLSREASRIDDMERTRPPHA